MSPALTLLGEEMKSGRLTFTTDPDAVADCEAHFVCVGTPQKRNENAADLRYVDAAIETLVPRLRPGAVVIGKSTVPVGTAERLSETVEAAEPEAVLVWNPEFLREGFAIEDTVRPDRLASGPPTAAAVGRPTWRRCIWRARLRWHPSRPSWSRWLRSGHEQLAEAQSSGIVAIAGCDAPRQSSTPGSASVGGCLPPRLHGPSR